MLPRLMAEESMLASTRVAIGSGTADKDESNKVRRIWAEVAQVAKPKALKASVEDVRAMGIAVRKVKGPRRG